MSDALWYGGMNTEADHDLTLVVPGNAEMLRQRLPAALAQLGYHVISDQPLLAKRAAVGGAKYACSFEPLDYPTKLLVGLRALNQNAASVTFSYEIKSYGWGLYEGDKDTLQREAQAITALALAGGVASSCVACGTEVTDDSRFCRRCGAPLAAASPDLEVYRLTRGTRAGLRDVGVGVVTLLAPMLLWLLLIVTRPGLTQKALTVLAVLSGLAVVFGLWALLEGVWELYRTVNPKETPGRLTSFTERPAPLPPVAAGPPLNALLPRPARFSVTEQTTEFLAPNPVPASLWGNRDTAEMEKVQGKSKAGG